MQIPLWQLTFWSSWNVLGKVKRELAFDELRRSNPQGCHYTWDSVLATAKSGLQKLVEGGSLPGVFLNIALPIISSLTSSCPELT